MSEERRFVTDLTITNPIGFAASQAKAVKKLLQERFEGRCWMGTFVVSIAEVERLSSLRILDNNSGYGTINITFRAVCRTYARWDIIAGVRLTTRNQLLLGEPAVDEDGARLIVSIHPKNAETLRIAQLVPVRLTEVRHPPTKETACAVGMLLTCDRAAPCFRIPAGGSLDPKETEGLAGLLGAIRAELSLREELLGTHTKTIGFFEGLLYSFRKEPRPLAPADPSEFDEILSQGAPRWRGPARVATSGDSAKNAAAPGGFVPVNFLELALRAAAGETVKVDGLWSRTLDLYRSSPLAGRAQHGGAEAETAPPRVVFDLLLRNMLSFLVAVRQLAELHGGEPGAKGSSIQEHENIWTVMRAAQLPV